MIFNLLLQAILLIFSAIFSILPVVDIASIPYAGEFIRENLINLVVMWNTVLETFPYGQTAWSIFLWVILPFEAIMLIGKFFLGSRLPSNVN